MEWTNDATRHICVGLMSDHVADAGFTADNARTVAETKLLEMVTAGELMAADRSDYLNSVDWAQVAEYVLSEDKPEDA